MNSNGNPSIDPADEGSLIGAMRFAFNKMMQDVNNMLPARVVSYDQASNRAEVELLITMLTTAGTQVTRGAIASLPVFILGAGGYVVNFPIPPGSLGWVKANDRDISIFLQTYTNSPPNTFRKANFSDGVFFPDAMKDVMVAGDETMLASFQSTDGTVRITLFPTFVKITAPDGLEIVTGGVTIDADGLTVSAGGANITGDVTITNPLGTTQITGNLHVTGNICATGTIGNPTASLIVC